MEFHPQAPRQVTSHMKLNRSGKKYVFHCQDGLLDLHVESVCPLDDPGARCLSASSKSCMQLKVTPWRNPPGFWRPGVILPKIGASSCLDRLRGRTNSELPAWRSRNRKAGKLSIPCQSAELWLCFVSDVTRSHSADCCAEQLRTMPVNSPTR